MPTVPYNPVPQGPQNVPIPFRTDRGADPTAFGANIGQSEMGFGKAVEGAGDVLQKQVLSEQELANTAAAKERVLDYAGKEGDELTKFHSLEGKDAGLQYDDFKAKIGQYRKDALQGLNPAAARIADQEITRRAEFAMTDAGRYAGGQLKVYQKNMDQASVKLAISDAGSSTDEARFQKRLDDIRNTHQKIAGPGGEGQSEQQAAVETNKSVSLAYHEYLFGMAQRRPFDAKRYFDEHQGDIKDPAVKDQIERMLHTAMETTGVGIRVEQATGGRSYQSALFTAESDNDPQATAKTSSAKGLAQFTDSTWDDLAKKHPELNLTPSNRGGQFSREQVERAEPVFRAENQQILKNAGIEPNDKNTYMAHVLGAGGAAKFLKGMQDNPDTPAVRLATPAAVEANESIFFDRQTGRQRTASEVYNRLTSTFGDGPEKPLSESTDEQWLDRTLEKYGKIADRDSGGDPVYRERVLDGIRTKYNQVHRDADAADRVAFRNLEDFIDKNKITDLKAITQNPDLNRIYIGMRNPEDRMRLEHQIGQNALKDVMPNQGQTETMRILKGMAQNDPEAFSKVDETQYGLTKGQQAEVKLMRQGVERKSQSINQFHEVASDQYVKNMLQGINLRASRPGEKPDKEWNTFTGGMTQALEDYTAEHKTKMPPKEYRQKAAELIAEIGRKPSGLFGLGAGTPIAAFDVPDSFKDEREGDSSLRDRLKARLGREPNDEEWGALYEHSKWQKRHQQ